MSLDRDQETKSTLRVQRAAIEAAANAIFITDMTGVIEWANPAFEALTGYRVDEVVGLTPRILKSSKHEEPFYNELWETILAGEVWSGRVTNRRKSGQLYTANQTITPIRDDNGATTHFVAIHDDVTAQLASQARIAHMALHDSLTDLPNRYALDRRLDIELARTRRSKSGVAVHWIDLDNFKYVNDTFGHDAGDQLLIAVSQRLTQLVRDIDLLCRVGGDEFAVVQPDVADRRYAAHLSERLLQAFVQSFVVGSQEIFVTASIGIAISDHDTQSKSAFMKQADLALYQAKNSGRNTYRFYDGTMETEIRRRMSLAQDLHRAIDREELFLEFQPQVGLSERRIVGVEALLRWRHPEIGTISPSEFVPIAESTGLIDEVGEWVLRTACRQAKGWQSRNLPAVPIAVNVSAVQLRDPRFASRVSHILADTDLEPQYLELELTESVLMEGKEYVDRALDTLDHLGVRLSLDDFGRGYASLDYLRRYPLSKVKIDQSFIADMDDNLKNATIVRGIIDLAAKLDLQVIAEGVEPAHLLQRLIAEGCAEVQGFYFSRPVSAEMLERLLTVGSDRIQAHPPRLDPIPPP